MAAPSAFASDGDAERFDCIQRLLNRSIPLATRKSPEKYPLTLGIEIEGYIPSSGQETSHQARGRVANEIARILRRKLPQLAETIHAREVILDWEVATISPETGQALIWKVVSEPSVQGESKLRGLEINSPILRSEYDLRLFAEIIEELGKKGFRANPANTGMHVHVGFRDAELAQISALYALFSAIEPQAVQTFSQSSTRSRWAHRSTLDQLLYLESRLEKGESINDILKSGDSMIKRTNLNVKSLGLYETVEFRLFNSTMSLDAILLTARFSGRLVEALRSKEPALMGYIQSTPPERFDLGKISELIGVPLGEHAETLDRIAAESRQVMQLPKKDARTLAQIENPRTEADELIDRLRQSMRELEAAVSGRSSSRPPLSTQAVITGLENSRQNLLRVLRAAGLVEGQDDDESQAQGR